MTKRTKERIFFRNSALFFSEYAEYAFKKCLVLRKNLSLLYIPLFIKQALSSSLSAAAITKRNTKLSPQHISSISNNIFLTATSLIGGVSIRKPKEKKWQTPSRFWRPILSSWRIRKTRDSYGERRSRSTRSKRTYRVRLPSTASDDETKLYEIRRNRW